MAMAKRTGFHIIVIAMILGVGGGILFHQQASPDAINKFSTNIKLLTQSFYGWFK